jgi:hypothetical protein
MSNSCQVLLADSFHNMALSMLLICRYETSQEQTCKPTNSFGALQFLFEFLVENAWMVGLWVLYTICMISCFEVESVHMCQLLVQMKMCSNIVF